MQASGDSNPVPDSSAEPWSACEAYRYSDAGSPRASPRPWCTRGLPPSRSEEHTSELQSQSNLVCRLLLEKKTFIQYLLAANPAASRRAFSQQFCQALKCMQSIRTLADRFACRSMRELELCALIAFPPVL